MTFSLDSTHEGQVCEYTVKGVVIKCTILACFERTNTKTGHKAIKYRIQSQDGVIYDNVIPSELTIKSKPIKK